MYCESSRPSSRFQLDPVDHPESYAAHESRVDACIGDETPALGAGIGGRGTRRGDVAQQGREAVVIERLQRTGEFRYRSLQVVAILGKQQAAGMSALRHRQIRRCPLVRANDLLQTCEDAQQRIRGLREVIDADVPIASGGNDGRRDDIGANGLQHQPDAFFEQANPADGILGIHDGLGIENIGIKPGEVPRIIGGGVRRPRDQKGLLRRKGTVDRVPVQLIDPGR